jgi:hypothetical protein
VYLKDYRDDEIFILAPSVRMEKGDSPVKLLANYLSNGGGERERDLSTPPARMRRSYTRR